MINIYRLIAIFSSIAGIAVILINGATKNTYFYCYMPISFLFISCVCSKMFEKVRIGLCLKLYTVIQMISYIVLPIMLSYTGSVSFFGVNPNDANLPYAVFIMCYSFIVTSFILEIYIRNRRANTTSIERIFCYEGNNNNDTVQSRLRIRKSTLFTAILLLAGTLYISMNTDVLIDYRFVWEENRFFRSESYGSFFSTALPRLVAMMIHYGIPMVAINISRKKFDKSVVVRIVVYTICLLGMCIVRGTNRLTILANGLAIYYSLVILHPKRKIFLTTSIFTAIVIIAVYTTIEKTFSGNLSSIGTGESAWKIVTGWVQLYVSSPRTMALAIELRQQSSGPNFLYSIKDLLTPIFGLGHLGTIIPMQETNSIYHAYVSHNGAVQPATGQILFLAAQGYYTFGFILSPIYVVTTALLCVKFDDIISRYRIMYHYSLFPVIFTGLITAVATCLNTNGYIQTITWGGIPLIIIDRLVTVYNVLPKPHARKTISR